MKISESIHSIHAVETGEPFLLIVTSDVKLKKLPTSLDFDLFSHILKLPIKSLTIVTFTAKERL
jgi:hypothetical protein